MVLEALGKFVAMVVEEEEAVFAVMLLLLVAVEFVATEVDVLVATSGWGADFTARSSRSCGRRADKK